MVWPRSSSQHCSSQAGSAFEQLGVKPLHHDESVNGWFMLSLANDGQYRYNPDNYHGPSLYYLTLLPLRLIGESEAALALGSGDLWPAWPSACSGCCAAGWVRRGRRRAALLMASLDRSGLLLT
jgi:hypothetical protein